MHAVVYSAHQLPDTPGRFEIYCCVGVKVCSAVGCHARCVEWIIQIALLEHLPACAMRVVYTTMAMTAPTHACILAAFKICNVHGYLGTFQFNGCTLAYQPVGYVKACAYALSGSFHNVNTAALSASIYCLCKDVSCFAAALMSKFIGLGNACCSIRAHIVGTL